MMSETTQYSVQDNEKRTQLNLKCNDVFLTLELNDHADLLFKKGQSSYDQRSNNLPYLKTSCTLTVATTFSIHWKFTFSKIPCHNELIIYTNFVVFVLIF